MKGCPREKGQGAERERCRSRIQRRVSGYGSEDPSPSETFCSCQCQDIIQQAQTFINFQINRCIENYSRKKMTKLLVAMYNTGWWTKPKYMTHDYSYFRHQPGIRKTIPGEAHLIQLTNFNYILEILHIFDNSKRRLAGLIKT